MPSRSLPKAAGGAVFVAILIALVCGVSSRSGPILLLGVCATALFSALGIWQRRVWGAYGFALLLAFSILLMLFFAVTGQTAGSFVQTLVAIVIYAAIGGLFVLAGLSLKVEGAKMGSPIPWIVIVLVLFAPFTVFRTVNVSDGSMQDTLLLGDSLLINRFASYKPAKGDIVAFYSPEDGKRILVDRVVELPQNAAQVNGFYVQGDATGTSRILVNASNIIGKPVFILDSLAVDPADVKAKELTHPLVHRWERVFKPL